MTAMAACSKVVCTGGSGCAALWDLRRLCGVAQPDPLAELLTFDRPAVRPGDSVWGWRAAAQLLADDMSWTLSRCCVECSGRVWGLHHSQCHTQHRLWRDQASDLTYGLPMRGRASLCTRLDNLPTYKH